MCISINIEQLILNILFFSAILNIKPIVVYLNPYFRKLLHFYAFVCENNPYDIDLYAPDPANPITEEQPIPPPAPKFEDKYLDKFTKFPNEFYFTDAELDDEQAIYQSIKATYIQEQTDLININRQKLMIIEEIQTKGNIDHSNTGPFTANMNSLGTNMLVILFDMLEEYEDEPESFDLEELYSDLLSLKQNLLTEMKTIETNTKTDDDLFKEARAKTINKKLDGNINNYILDYTPQGNVYMRYNNDKKSFEYFSNNTIPYRYLEPLARKYVMTYWCKPIFVDMDAELKKSEEKPIVTQVKNNLTPFKHMGMSAKPMKNRNDAKIRLPPQIKANFPDVNKTSGKQLLKENANRYTWEGRLTDFCPLKKINRKILDKKLAMSYADFKKMQQK